MKLFGVFLKTKISRRITILSATLLTALLVFPVWAGAQPPGFEDESPYGTTDVPAPIDDWVVVLVAVAVVYGVIKAKAIRKKGKPQSTIS